jgi:hypothetical protein
MEEKKSDLDNGLAQMKERVALQHETKAAKMTEEQNVADLMSADMERDVKLPWL